MKHHIKLLAILFFVSNNIFAQNSVIKVVKVLRSVETNIRKDYSSKGINVFEKNREFLLIEINDHAIYKKYENNFDAFCDDVAKKVIIYCNAKDVSFIKGYEEIRISFINKNKAVSHVLKIKSIKIKDMYNAQSLN